MRFPLGSWLRDDLLIEATMATGQAVRDAARLVGMPESTFRRRLRAAVERQESGLASRMEGWDRVRAALANLTRSKDQGGGDLQARTQEILLREILDGVPNDAQVGSQILGVSPPTFRRRAREIRDDL